MLRVVREVRLLDSCCTVRLQLARVAWYEDHELNDDCLLAFTPRLLQGSIVSKLICVLSFPMFWRLRLLNCPNACWCLSSIFNMVAVSVAFCRKRRVL